MQIFLTVDRTSTRHADGKCCRRFADLDPLLFLLGVTKLSSDLTVDPVIRWQRRFAEDRGTEFWTVNTLQMIEQMKLGEVSTLRSMLKNYTYWIDRCSRHPVYVDAQLFGRFIDQFARIAANLGEPGDAGVVAALDQAIKLVGPEAASVSYLYIAKARYYRTIANENRERLSAIMAAISNSTRGGEGWAEAMLELSGYYSDTSQYELAMSSVAELRSSLAPELLAAKYECGAKVREAAALFGHFRSRGRIEQMMLSAIEQYGVHIDKDEDLVRWVAMAYYYLGRVGEVRRRYAEALYYYLKGLEIREGGPEDLRVLGFFHVRIAELLIAAGNAPDARDHVGFAAYLYRMCSNQGSGWIQNCLNYASLAAMVGEYDTAFATVSEVQVMAQELGYWRGELLGLGYLLALHIRYRKFWRLPAVVYAILRTVRHGELSRNSVVRLALRMPPIVVKAIPRRGLRNRIAAVDGIRCSCRLHMSTLTDAMTA